MNRLSFLVFFFMTGCVFSELDGAYAEKAEIQIDEFAKKNPCGIVATSRLPVLSLNFSLPAATSRIGPLTFEVRDRLGHFRQMISYQDGVFSYGEMFGKAIHRELNAPVCDSKTCQFELYVFIQDWRNARRVMQIRVHVLFENRIRHVLDFSPIKNVIQENIVKPMPPFEVTIDNKSEIGRLIVSSDSLQRLVDMGATESEVVLQWKDSNSLRYLEQSTRIDLKSRRDVQLQDKLPGATYVAGMLMYKVGSVSFEAKIELKNDEDKFYECKNDP